MKRNILALTVVTLTASLLLSACGARSAEESPSPANENPTPSATETAPTGREYPLIVDAGSTVTVDLNGDGKEDEIRFETTEDKYSILHLSVNGTDFAKSVADQGFYSDMLEDAYCVTDIDTSDNMLEIAIMDYGPSDDCITDFFRYDGVNLKHIGYVSGLIVSSYSDKSDLTFNGDGTISSYIRLSVLQTWWAAADWRLSQKGGFEIVPADLYYPTSASGCDVTALVDVTTYASNSGSSEKTVLPVGTALKFIATDNKQWVLAEISEGKQCWVHLDAEYGQMVETANGYDYSDKVFSGLCIAD